MKINFPASFGVAVQKYPSMRKEAMHRCLASLYYFKKEDWS
jgi:hypothetical protein